MTDWLAKAAAFSMTQSLRTLLADSGVSVHAVLTGIVDTDMSRGVDVQKASAESVAQGILERHRNQTEHRGHRGHQNRAQSDAARVHHRVEQRHAIVLEPVGELDDQDAVGNDHPDHHHHAHQ